MIDLIKTRGITAVFTTLGGDGSLVQEDDLGVSSLMDSWVKLQNMEANGERTRTLYVIIRSTGIAASAAASAGVHRVPYIRSPASPRPGTM
ncbi:hypothetical protein JOE48_001697 [Methylobacterium sp. PvR107]|nr:hypothetical protein [Methylobacterium sp. PvR107]